MSCELIFSGHQPNFLPYMGFFYKMFQSDVFVLDDDVQYSTTGLHNANFINIKGARHRITVPVHSPYGKPINCVDISYERGWGEKLLKTLKMVYGRTPHFSEGYELYNDYVMAGYSRLSNLNIALIKQIASNFGLECKIVVASEDVPTELKNQERNVYQCQKLGCQVYYSGVGGKAYNNEEYYNRHGIKLVYSDYTPIEQESGPVGAPENLSVLDYIFNHGYVIPESWRKTYEE